MSKIKQLFVMLITVAFIAACADDSNDNNGSGNANNGGGIGPSNLVGTVWAGDYKPYPANTIAVKIKNETEIVTERCSGKELAITNVKKEIGQQIRFYTYTVKDNVYTITGVKNGRDNNLHLKEIRIENGQMTMIDLDGKVICVATLIAESNDEQDKKYIFDEINKYRTSNGVPELKNAETIKLECINRVASQRVTEIEKLFDHKRPDGRPLETIFKEIKHCQFTIIASHGEIIAQQPSAEKAMEEWKKSGGHSKTMLKRNFNAAAVAKNGQYYVVFFVETQL